MSPLWLVEWRGLAPFTELDCYAIAGNHYTMLQPPHVAGLAQILRTQFT